MAMIGHNRRPVLTGSGWRRHCWQVARENLLPVLPIEVVRTRVRRAKDLGLDDKTYAGVRATTGHDLVAFLFSSNALRLMPTGRIPDPEAAKLATSRDCGRIALAQCIAPTVILLENPATVTATGSAPLPCASFQDQVAALRRALGGVPGDRVLLVTSAPWEMEWVDTGRLAGMLPAARYFA